MSGELLTAREESVLEAVIRTYVETAEPAGSRTVAKRFDLGVSPATVRNTMADLEDKGFLFHPHTSAGRIPTDHAYRYFVDTLMRPRRLSIAERRRLRRELAEPEGMPALERLVHRSAQVIGLLTGELGVAIAPRLEDVVLERLELIGLSSEKVLLVLRLQSGAVRTIYVDLPASVPDQALVAVTAVLNERLAGRTMGEIRRTLPERLRDVRTHEDDPANSLLNIFLQSAEELFESGPRGENVHLGRTSVLANQPEFASGHDLKSLIELTERRDLLSAVLSDRNHDATLKITIGTEHEEPELSTFTLVTAEYTVGGLSGILGVIGPTRMAYDKVVTVVDTARAVLLDLLSSPDTDPEQDADDRDAESETRPS